jgi:hypothetical protein
MARRRSVPAPPLPPNGASLLRLLLVAALVTPSDSAAPATTPPFSPSDPTTLSATPQFSPSDPAAQQPMEAAVQGGPIVAIGLPRARHTHAVHRGRLLGSGH